MTTATKDKPILFSGPMVRAILEGRKTQTRRVIKPQPIVATDGKADWMVRGRWKGAVEPKTGLHNMASPYGAAGDRLWVRETWRVSISHENVKPSKLCEFTCSTLMDVDHKAKTTDHLMSPGRWRPSIYMPRWASRILLQVTEARVERLQEITEEDAQAEGFQFEAGGNEELGVGWRIGFSKVWDTINSKRGFSWDSNPWVWVVCFKRLKP